jgi:hypothetical protein
VRKLVVRKIAAREDLVDERKARRWTITHRVGSGAIEFYDR